MQVHTLTSMFSVSLCVQADSDGGERSELFAFEGAASQRTEKADATAVAAIPLTTTHGGHPLHVQIL